MQAFCCTLLSRGLRPDGHRFRPAFLSRSLLTAALVIASLGGPGALAAQSARTFESPLPVPEAKEKLEELLQRLDNGRYYYDEETEGYTWRAQNRWYSPFDYDFYGGVVSSKQATTLIRIEGAAGDVRTLSRILYEEKFFVENSMPEDRNGAAPLGRKYHLISQPVNLLAPWLGVLYNSYGSPRLTRGQTFWRFMTYFFFDALFIYAGGTNWFQQGAFEPQKFSGNIAAGLAVTRIVGAYQSMNLIRGHNRVAELKFTFPISD